MTGPWYATREQMMEAFDIKASAYVASLLDRNLETASRGIERMTHRRFYPTVDTRIFPWPLRGSVFIPDDVQSLTSLSIDGRAVTGHVLEPRFQGPPYTWIDFDDASISSGDDITVEGVFGYSADTAPAGALAAAITTTGATTCTVTNGSLVGVGDLLLVDSERVKVTGKGSTSSGATLGGNVAAAANTTAISVSNGSVFNVGETILVDSERMLVLDITSNTLHVRRADSGTTLAAHSSGATVYTYRLLTIERGAAGTTAATHLISTALYRNVPPGPINELCLAEAMYAIQQEKAGWQAVIGAGENSRESAGRGVGDLRRLVKMEYGKPRWAAV